MSRGAAAALGIDLIRPRLPEVKFHESLRVWRERMRPRLPQQQIYAPLRAPKALNMFSENLRNSAIVGREKTPWALYFKLGP
jgi:hypothetical protein